MEVTALGPGLWRWTAPHPDWKPSEDWPQMVGCVYYETPGAVVLVDPLVPAGEEDRFWAALDRDVERLERPVVSLLTVRWHERSLDEVARRYGGTTWRSEADGEPPAGVVAYSTEAAEEHVFWLTGPRAVVPGDTLLNDTGTLRLCPPSWLDDEAKHDAMRCELEPLLELPVEQVLVSHGEPVTAHAHDALAAALKAQ
jgi:glyoxylase-like metal-dependent hydrolase (beta-lactamase superfamily II)